WRAVGLVVVPRRPLLAPSRERRECVGAAQGHPRVAELPDEPAHLRLTSGVRRRGGVPPGAVISAQLVERIGDQAGARERLADEAQIAVTLAAVDARAAQPGLDVGDARLDLCGFAHGFASPSGVARAESRAARRARAGVAASP